MRDSSELGAPGPHFRFCASETLESIMGLLPPLDDEALPSASQPSASAPGAGGDASHRAAVSQEFVHQWMRNGRVDWINEAVAQIEVDGPLRRFLEATPFATVSSGSPISSAQTQQAAAIKPKRHSGVLSVLSAMEPKLPRSDVPKPRNARQEPCRQPDTVDQQQKQQREAPQRIVTDKFSDTLADTHDDLARLLSKEQIQTVFHLTSKDAAKQLGITTSLLMRACRLHGTTRWPYRKMASLETLRQAIIVDGNISEEERKAICASIALEMDALRADPNREIGPRLEALCQVNHKQVYSEKYKEPHLPVAAVSSPGAGSESTRRGGGSSTEASPRCGCGGSGSGRAAFTAATAAAGNKKRRLKSYLAIAVTKSLEQLTDGGGGRCCEEDNELASVGGGGGGRGGRGGSHKASDAAAGGGAGSRKVAERTVRGSNLSGLTVQMTGMGTDDHKNGRAGQAAAPTCKKGQQQGQAAAPSDWGTCEEELQKRQQQERDSSSGWSFDAFGSIPPLSSDGARPDGPAGGDALGGGGSLLREWPDGWYAAPADRGLAGLMPGEGDGNVIVALRQQQQQQAPLGGIGARSEGLLSVSRDLLCNHDRHSTEEEGTTGGDSGSLLRLLEDGFRDNSSWDCSMGLLPGLPGEDGEDPSDSISLPMTAAFDSHEHGSSDSLAEVQLRLPFPQQQQQFGGGDFGHGSNESLFHQLHRRTQQLRQQQHQHQHQPLLNVSDLLPVSTAQTLYDPPWAPGGPVALCAPAAAHYSFWGAPYPTSLFPVPSTRFEELPMLNMDAE